MSWRDNLLPASFRGVGFKVLDSTRSAGRKSVLHDYPFKDLPAVEDLGVGNRQFTIEGYVAQTADNDHDYFPERDDLITALETEGSGELIHPFYGHKQVALAQPAQIRESFVNGSGVALFSMTFVEVDDLLIPTENTDHKTTVENQSRTVNDESKKEFASLYNPNGLDQIANGALTDAKAFLNKVRAKQSAVQTGATSVLAGALNDLSEIETLLEQTILFPEQFAQAIANIFDVYDPLLDSLTLQEGSSLVQALLSLQDFGQTAGDLDVITTNTPSREQQNDNRNVMLDFCRGAAISTACRFAIYTPYESRTQAFEMLQLIVDTLDSYWLVTTNDYIYNLLQSLKASVVDGLFALGASLPSDITYTPKQTTSALELAYFLYGDINREQEIIERNRTLAFHPGFIAGGEDVEVLSE